MGCCQSTTREHEVLRRQGPPAAKDACFPDKQFVAGLKVLTSCAVAPSAGNSNSTGHTYTRLVVGPNWLFAALFEAARAGGGTDGTKDSPYCDSAAQYCIEHCYAEFQKNISQGRDSTTDLCSALEATLRSLDRRFLADGSVLPQDRLASGCTGVLLHLALPTAPTASAAPASCGSGPLGNGAATPSRSSSPLATSAVSGVEAVPTASVACVGPCGALLCRTVGGLASATSDYTLLAGGGAASHDALQDFLRALAAEVQAAAPPQQPGMGRAASRHGKAKGSGKLAAGGRTGQQYQYQQAAEEPQEPRYSRDPAAPQALGFGAAKGLSFANQVLGGAARAGVNGGGAGDAPAPPPEPRVGLEVQTACHALRPTDECVVLLSGSAAAALSPADAALLMHRLGRIAGVPFESKHPPLPPNDGVAVAGGVQLDSLGAAGPRPPPSGAVTAPAAGAVPPFNAARLLAAHAAANLAARRPGPERQQRGAAATSGLPPPCVMALGLQWPSATSTSAPADSAMAMAAAGASTAAVAAAAAAAVRERQAALYRWQLLRLYYKFPHRRHVTIIEKWHEVFDAVLGAANRKARAAEISAWRRRNAVVQVSPAGNVKSVKTMQSSSPQQQQSSPPPQQHQPNQSPQRTPQQQHSQHSLLQSPPRPYGSRSRLPTYPAAAAIAASPPRPGASASAIFGSAVTASPPRPVASASAVTASTVTPASLAASVLRSAAAASAFASAAGAAATAAAAVRAPSPATPVTPIAQLLLGSGLGGDTGVKEQQQHQSKGASLRLEEAVLVHAEAEAEACARVPRESPSMMELSFRSESVGQAPVAEVAAAGTAATAAAVAAPDADEGGSMAMGQPSECQSHSGRSVGHGSSFRSLGSSGLGAYATSSAVAATADVRQEGLVAARAGRQSGSGVAATPPRAPSPSLPSPNRVSLPAPSPTGSAGGGSGQLRTLRSSIPSLQLPRPQGIPTATVPGTISAASLTPVATPLRATGIPTPGAASPNPAAGAAGTRLPVAASPIRSAATPAPAATVLTASGPAAPPSAPAAVGTPGTALSGVPRITPRTSIPTRIPSNPGTPGGLPSGLPAPPAATPPPRARGSAIPSPTASAGGACVGATATAAGGSFGGAIPGGPSPSARVSASGGDSQGGAIPLSSPSAAAAGPRSSISRLPRPGIAPTKPPTTVGAAPTRAGAAASPSLSPPVAASAFTGSESVARSLFAGSSAAAAAASALAAAPVSAAAAAVPGSFTAAAADPPDKAPALRPPRLGITVPARTATTRGASGTFSTADCAAAPALIPTVSLTLAPEDGTGGPDMGDEDDEDLMSPDADQLAAWAMEAVNVIAASPSASPHKQGQAQEPQGLQEPAPRMPLSPRNSADVYGPARGASGRVLAGGAAAGQPRKASSLRSQVDGSAPPGRASSWLFRR